MSKLSHFLYEWLYRSNSESLLESYFIVTELVIIIINYFDSPVSCSPFSYPCVDEFIPIQYTVSWLLVKVTDMFQPMICTSVCVLGGRK